MAEYRYIFADLLTDNDLCEISLSNVRFDRRIIQPGAFSANISVPNKDIGSQVRKIIPGRTICHVIRNGQIWGSYIIWSKRERGDSSGDITVALQGATLESWFYHRIIDAEYSFIDADQIDIARSLIGYAQSGRAPYQNAADLNIQVKDGLSGTIQTRHYHKVDLASIGQRLEELAGVDNGFEYMIHTSIDSATNTRPRVWYWGTQLSSTGSNIIFEEQPGNVKEWEILYDAASGGNVFWARGDNVQSSSAAQSEPLITPSPAFSDTYLNNGWPYLEVVHDYSSVKDVTTLNSYAAWWAYVHGGPIMIPQFTIKPSESNDNNLTPYRLGDYVEVKLNNPLYPLNNNGTPSFTGKFRAIGFEMSISDRTSEESMKVVIASSVDPTDTGV